MRRRDFFPLILLTGCAAERPLSVDVLPVTLDGGWRRGDARTGGLEGAPEPVRALGAGGTVEASYSVAGGNPVRVRLYRMPAQASAFEAAQKMRPAPGLVFFYRERYFVLVEGAKFEEARAVADALRPALLPGRD
jgi:hypothetical protein